MILAGVGVAVLVIAAAAVIYFSAPEVWYWQAGNYRYEKQGAGWVTFNYETNSSSNGTFTAVYCQNKGSFDTKFDFVVKLTGAAFRTDTDSNPNIKETEADLSVTLHSQQAYSTRLYFSIDQNVSRFDISINLQPHQLFMRSRNTISPPTKPASLHEGYLRRIRAVQPSPHGLEFQERYGQHLPLGMGLPCGHFVG